MRWGRLSGSAAELADAARARPATRRVLLAIGVALAYYAGAQIGVVLRLPASTPSAIWPPNAIVLAVLLLVPPREWWVVIAGALSAHLAAELPFGWPLPMVLLLFGTNIGEALIGAVAVRQLSDAPSRLDTLQRMTSFIAAAGLLAPIVSSFGDAAAVSLFHGEPYWEVWRSRTFSNILSDLTVAPAIVAVLGQRGRRLTRADPSVRLEAALLGVVLLGMAALAFVEPSSGGSLVAGAPRVLVAFLLPCLLWAAVRFGPAGASLALVTTALVANWGALHGRGPFEHLSPDSAVLALQLFLSVIAVPVLCLGALIEERWTTEAALADRLAFEELLSRLSAAFVAAPGRVLDETAAIWLGKLAVYLRVDCAWLLRTGAEPSAMTLATSWTAPLLPIRAPVAPMRDLGWMVERALAGEATEVAARARLEGPARRALERLGLGAVLCVPVSAGAHVYGALVLGSGREPRPWPEAVRARVQLVSEVFASALARQAADAALRAGEALKSAILASLSSGVAVLDRTGRVIAVNERWNLLAHDQHEIVFGDVGVGADYLDLCFQAALRGAPYAGTVRAGVEAVLGRSRPVFTLEYETAGPAGGRWAVLSAVPLSGADGGAVVTHTDVTERRRAELEAQRTRQELAHFTRVSTVGALTASVAHQLNQPLTGILSNAQAARRLLDAQSPDLATVRGILDDIVGDDERAADVIRQMRDLMRHGPADHVLLDLNAVVQGVVHLVSSDAVTRSVGVGIELTPDMPIVQGNKVDLQQVILNLVMNALDAVRGAPERRVVVRTRLAPPDVEVEVEDTGPGVEPGAMAHVFEPFYSTKPGGMGMGLSIARSILDAHGGTIDVHERQPVGTIFRFTLPLAGARAG